MVICFHSLDVRDSKSWILNSTPWIPDIGFRIPIVGGILDSLIGIPDSKSQSFGFHKENFLGFLIP